MFYLSIATSNNRWEFCSEWPENTVNVTLMGESSIVICLNDCSAWFQCSEHSKTITFSSSKNYVSMDLLAKCKLHNIMKKNATYNSKCGSDFDQIQFFSDEKAIVFRSSLRQNHADQSFRYITILPLLVRMTFTVFSDHSEQNFHRLLLVVIDR